MIVNEMVHATRIIPLDGRPRLDSSIRQWLGSSRGRWEGDTLVVETTNRRYETAFRGSGEHMHLTERFTRVADDVLLYEFTVDDPENFKEPWTAQILSNLWPAPRRCRARPCSGADGLHGQHVTREQCTDTSGGHVRMIAAGRGCGVDYRSRQEPQRPRRPADRL